jgi:HTH-type transcriptional regulator / antitoxin HipB
MDYPILSPGQLSAHLRALRKARGLSQAQLGAVLGVGQTRVTRIERDPAAISVEQLLALLGALGVQVVLRLNGPGAAVARPEAGSKPKPTRAAAAKRRPADEPW